VGGWGYLLGDEGSGYDIGRQALIAVGKEFDGLGSKTALTPLVLQSLNIEDAALIPQVVYRDPAPKLRIAHVCSIAAQAAQGGDLIARQLFSQGGKGLGEMACSIIRRLHLNGPSVVASGVGGVFHTGELIWNPYRQEILQQFPGAEVTPPRFPPVVGALLLAYQNGGERLSPQLLQALSNVSLKN
jgi:N-acetylglucosamine kinase-like BadF-type ATPase